MIPTETWFPVVTLLAGTVLGGLLEALRDRRARKREEAARAEARADADRLRRLEFQRETLISLQDETTKLTRIIGQIHHHDLIVSRETGAPWGRTPVAEKLDGGALATVQTVGKLRVRVEDETLRKMVADLSTIYSRVSLAQSEPDGERAIAPLSDCSTAIDNRIGELLRSL